MRRTARPHPARRDAGPRQPSARQLRVGEELRHALAWILERGEVHDPDLIELSITVTEVRTSPDLRQATVFVVPLGGGDPAPALALLRRHRGLLRHLLAERVRLKYTPDLAFQPDGSFDAAGRIEAILRQPDVARDLQQPEADDPGADDGA